MNPSLTVVLPLRNVESSLPSLLAELLEILPDLTPKFEVVLVDDGSTDHTAEVAHEQSLAYPQVQLLIHPAQLGAQESLRSALRYSRGEQLVVCRDVADFDPQELTKLCGIATLDGAVAGMYEKVGGVGTIPRLPSKGSTINSPTPDAALPDLLMVPRRLLLGWQQSGDRQGVVEYMRNRGFALPTLSVRSRRSRTPSLAVIAAGIRRGLQARPSIATARRTQSKGAQNDTRPTFGPTSERTIDPPTPAQTRGPSYLISRLRAFTWGD